MAVHFHEEDLPGDVTFADGPIAIDTEAMGLIPVATGCAWCRFPTATGDEHLVRFGPGSDYAAPNLKALLADPARLKLYHFARFDLAIMQAYLGVMAAPLYCTRTASRLVRTYTDRHGLKELVKEMLATDYQQAATDQRLGRARTQRRAARICRERRALPAPAEDRARQAPGAREAHRAGPGLFRFPARAGHARPGGLGRAGYFRAHV